MSPYQSPGPPPLKPESLSERAQWENAKSLAKLAGAARSLVLLLWLFWLFVPAGYFGVRRLVLVVGPRNLGDGHRGDGSRTFRAKRGPK